MLIAAVAAAFVLLPAGGELAPRNSPLARRQKSEFLRTNGAVIDVCGGAPCVP